jgi:hypothetical protein
MTSGPPGGLLPPGAGPCRDPADPTRPRPSASIGPRSAPPPGGEEEPAGRMRGLTAGPSRRPELPPRGTGIAPSISGRGTPPSAVGGIDRSGSRPLRGSRRCRGQAGDRSRAPIARDVAPPARSGPCPEGHEPGPWPGGHDRARDVPNRAFGVGLGPRAFSRGISGRGASDGTIRARSGGSRTAADVGSPRRATTRPPVVPELLSADRTGSINCIARALRAASAIHEGAGPVA